MQTHYQPFETVQEHRKRGDPMQTTSRHEADEIDGDATYGKERTL